MVAGHFSTHQQEEINREKPENQHKKIKQAMIPLQGMAENRFSSVYFIYQCISR